MSTISRAVKSFTSSASLSGRLLSKSGSSRDVQVSAEANKNRELRLQDRARKLRRLFVEAKLTYTIELLLIDVLNAWSLAVREEQLAQRRANSLLVHKKRREGQLELARAWVSVTVEMDMKSVAKHLFCAWAAEARRCSQKFRMMERRAKVVILMMEAKQSDILVSIVHDWFLVMLFRHRRRSVIRTIEALLEPGSSFVKRITPLLRTVMNVWTDAVRATRIEHDNQLALVRIVSMSIVRRERTSKYNALDAWRAHVALTRMSESAMKQALVRIGLGDSLLLSCAVSSWAKEASEQRRVAERLMEANLRRDEKRTLVLKHIAMTFGLMDTSAKSVAFNAWMHSVNQAKSKDKLMKNALATWGLEINQLVSLAIASWSNIAKESRIAKTRHAEELARNREIRLLAVEKSVLLNEEVIKLSFKRQIVDTWMRFRLARHHEGKTKRKALVHFELESSGLSVGVFKSWAHTVKEERRKAVRQQKYMMKSLAVLKGSSDSSMKDVVIRAWTSLAGRAKERKKAQRNFLLQWGLEVGQLKAGVFHCWARQTKEDVQAKKEAEESKKAAAEGATKQQTQRNKYISMCLNVRERARHRSMKDSLFNSWQRFVARKKIRSAAKRKAQKLIDLNRHTLSAFLFVLWSRTIIEKKEREGAKRKRMMRVEMNNRAEMSHVVGRWASFTRYSVSQKKTMQDRRRATRAEALQNKLDKQDAKVVELGILLFVVWRRFIVDKKERERKLQKTFARWGMQSDMYCVLLFSSWAALMRDARHEKERQKAQLAEAASKAELAMKCFAAMSAADSMSVKSVVVQAWGRALKERKAKDELRSKALTHLGLTADQMSGLTFAAWAREVKEVQLNKQKTLQETLAKESEKEKLLLRCLSTLCAQNDSSTKEVAFRAWLRLVEVRREKEAAKQAALSRIEYARSELAAEVFDAWALDSKSSKQDAEKTRRETERRRAKVVAIERSLEMAVMRWTGASKEAVVKVWRQVVDETRKRIADRSHALARLMLETEQLSTLVLGAWCGFAKQQAWWRRSREAAEQEEAERAQRLRFQAAARLVATGSEAEDQLLLSSLFAAWQRSIKDGKLTALRDSASLHRDRQLALRQRLVDAKIGLHAMLLSSCALLSWRGHARGRRAFRKVASKAVAVLQLRDMDALRAAVAAAWLALAKNEQFYHAQDEFERQKTLELKQRGEERLRAILRSVDMKMRLQRGQNALFLLQLWSSYGRGRCRRRESLSRVQALLGRHRRDGLVAAFLPWFMRAKSTSRVMRVVVPRLERMRLARYRGFAFRCWCGLSAASRTLRATRREGLALRLDGLLRLRQQELHEIAVRVVLWWATLAARSWTEELVSRVDDLEPQARRCSFYRRSTAKVVDKALQRDSRGNAWIALHVWWMLAQMQRQVDLEMDRFLDATRAQKRLGAEGALSLARRAADVRLAKCCARLWRGRARYLGLIKRRADRELSTWPRGLAVQLLRAWKSCVREIRSSAELQRLQKEAWAWEAWAEKAAVAYNAAAGAGAVHTWQDALASAEALLSPSTTLPPQDQDEDSEASDEVVDDARAPVEDSADEGAIKELLKHPPARSPWAAPPRAPGASEARLRKQELLHNLSMDGRTRQDVARKEQEPITGSRRGGGGRGSAGLGESTAPGRSPASNPFSSGAAARRRIGGGLFGSRRAG
eukprot:TRINITY_DN22228_c0_g3_i1.p1 TRINITY_DN22228_c0_g3~~TRINITY_DN22228_c0_g3_i1.p1  ORF type:complete len:1674 (+),score=365.84 TRINITY_DN22228_c0_g3_i1:103-5124(+)